MIWPRLGSSVFTIPCSGLHFDWKTSQEIRRLQSTPISKRAIHSDDFIRDKIKTFIVQCDFFTRFLCFQTQNLAYFYNIENIIKFMTPHSFNKTWLHPWINKESRPETKLQLFHLFPLITWEDGFTRSECETKQMSLNAWFVITVWALRN